MKDTDADPSDGGPISRRDVLRTVGAAGAIGTLGAGTASAKRPKEFCIGTKPGKADVAKRRASKVINVVKGGKKGPTVVGRWPEEALNGLRNNPHIRYVEERQFDEIHYDLPDQILPWGLDRVDAEFAHAAGDDGDTVHVAISDTGIDADHPDLQGNLGTGYATDTNKCADGSHPDGSCDEDWDDTDGHGTHVAGTVAAINNSEGVLGVAPKVELHAVKIFPNASHDKIKEGLIWAAQQGYDVINMSHGGSDSQTKKEGVEEAADAGVLLVSSAGNDGNKSQCDDDDCIGYPAAYDEVIAVSNTTDTDALRSSSSVGPEMDIAAPGTDIPSTWFDGEYNTISGTSMASPHVAGAGALLIADGEDAASARTKLESSAVDIGLASFEQGNGLLDVAGALGHNTANDLLEVETKAPTNISWTGARLRGELVRLTGSAHADVAFEWGPDGGGFPNKTADQRLTSLGSFDETIGGLEEDATYQYRTVVENAEGSIERGEMKTFTTVDNEDPVANIVVTPPEPTEDDPVEFDGTGSSDGDFGGDSIVSYEWDLDDDGVFETTGDIVTWTYADGGTKEVHLRVTDEFDQTDTATKSFDVNHRPEAAFTVSPDPVVRNEAAEFDASDSDDADGTVETYEWDWSYDGSTFSADETTSSPTTSHTFASGGEHTVALRVVDDDDAQSETVATKTFTVYIRVEIDIKPISNGQTTINLRSKGEVPVAVLQTSAFDPTARLDPSTVHFGDPDDVGFDTSTSPPTPEGGAVPAHTGGHVEDVDGDGNADSLFHFPTVDADFDADDTEGELVGTTTDGVPVFGSENVKIVGNRP